MNILDIKIKAVELKLNWTFAPNYTFRLNFEEKSGLWRQSWNSKGVKITLIPKTGEIYHVLLLSMEQFEVFANNDATLGIKMYNAINRLKLTGNFSL